VLMWAIENVDNAAAAGTVLHPTARFAGHTDVVEAVACHPDQQEECCSGGDDRLLIFWDARQPTMPTTVVRGLHNGDINCLSWNAIDTRLVATGCSDGAVQVFDRRKLSQPLRRFGSCERGASVHGPPAYGHTKSVFSVEWMPNSNRVLGSGSEDGKVLLWDLEAAQASAPVVFVHPGHCHQVLDLSWNPSSPNTMASLSEPENGGKLQLWRISELISGDFGELAVGAEERNHAAELQQYLVENPSAPEAVGDDHEEEEYVSVRRSSTRRAAKSDSASISSASAGVARSELDKPAPDTKRQRTPGNIRSEHGSATKVTTVVEAAFAVLGCQDPHGHGMAIGAVWHAIEQARPNQWDATSSKKALQKASATMNSGIERTNGLLGLHGVLDPIHIRRTPISAASTGSAPSTGVHPLQPQPAANSSIAPHTTGCICPACKTR
jgi:hypothetical protein